MGRLVEQRRKPGQVEHAGCAEPDATQDADVNEMPPLIEREVGEPASGMEVGDTDAAAVVIAPMPPPPSAELGPNFSAGAAIGYGWRGFKANWGSFLGMSVLMILVAGVFSSVGENSGSAGMTAVFQLIGQALTIDVVLSTQAVRLEGLTAVGQRTVETRTSEVATTSSEYLLSAAISGAWKVLPAYP